MPPLLSQQLDLFIYLFIYLQLLNDSAPALKN